MKALLIGATRGMGRSLARLMVERGDQLFLLGRDESALEVTAADLTARGASGSVGTAFCDLESRSGFEAALDAAWAGLEGVDTVVVTAGLFGTQESLEADAVLRQRVLSVDFANTVEFCEQVRMRLLADGGGTLCVFSSVAGDRARKKVVLYGAAKAGLSSYLEGVDLRYREAGLRTVLIKPGFVRTSMTAALDEPPFAVGPDEAARGALRAIDRGASVAYVPPVWRLVMLIIRSLPTWVLRRTDF
ncbi:MAG: short-chain dehydrogenase [Acidobacteria bacterium]|nr:short-chain dehydrogenase [Acidobacteriota bacterium]|tara:strand:+ start:1091 stop:1828 length:738 start_codon:yes stop_codon:yes gene_type:complete